MHILTIYQNLRDTAAVNIELYSAVVQCSAGLKASEDMFFLLLRLRKRQEMKFSHTE